MPRLTVTVDEEQDAYLASKVEADDDLGSKSAAIRKCITSDEQLAELETENERLHRERRQLLNQRQENTELQEYVEDEQRYRKASLGTRIRWWFRGME